MADQQSPSTNQPYRPQGERRRMGGGYGRPRRGTPQGPPPEYEQKVLDIARVARVTSGGRRFNFRVTMVIGNRKGKVGVATGRGRDVALAIEKAARNARKKLVAVHMTPEGSIPHEVFGKQTSAKVFLKPTKAGRGIIAGGAVRTICELAGYKDVTGKILGRSTNKYNNAAATLNALKSLVYIKAASEPKEEEKDEPTEKEQKKPVAKKSPAKKKSEAKKGA
jgi:small subunit ribosomal protein S5